MSKRIKAALIRRELLGPPKPAGPDEARWDTRGYEPKCVAHGLTRCPRCTTEAGESRRGR
jgi:hypothetical protein